MLNLALLKFGPAGACMADNSLNCDPSGGNASLSMLQMQSARKLARKPYFELSTSNLEERSRSSGTPYLYGCSAVVIVALVASAAKEVCAPCKGNQVLTSKTRRILQSLAIGQILVEQSDSAFMVPLSFDFAQSIRQCNGAKADVAFLSGVIQSSYPLGMAFGLCLAFFLCKHGTYEFKRRCMFTAPAVASVLHIALAFALQNAASLRNLLEGIVILIRVLSGVVGGFDILLSTLARDVTVADEQVTFSVLEYMATAAGVGFGPLLSSFASLSVDRHCGEFHRETQAASLMSGAHAILVFCIFMCVPVNAPSMTASENDDEEESGTMSYREQAWKTFLGFFCVCIGIFSCSAVEVSSSLILELQYSWDTPSIGLAMGLVYTVIIFFCGGLIMMQTCIGDYYLIGLLAAGILLGAALLFDFGHSSSWQLLFADLVLFPCLNALLAILDGWLYIGHEQIASTPGIYFAVYFSDSIARTLAAPTVRKVIAVQGRNAYALLQCSLLAVLVSLAFYVSKLQAKATSRSDARCLIENGWFIEKNKDWPGPALAIEVKEVLLQKRTAIQDLLVFQSTHWGNVLVLDGAIVCTERDDMSHREVLAHLAMFSHANPRQVLIVGGGDGGILREVCKHSCVDSATLCEIDGDIIQACKLYFPAMTSSFHDKRVTVKLMDAVEYVEQQANDSYDVVIVDISDPVGPAVGLFSQKFYQDLKRVMRPSGILCAQCENTCFVPELFKMMSAENGKIFSSAECASIQITTYAGCRTVALICRKGNPEDSFEEVSKGCSIPLRKPTAGMELCHYTPELHTAAFQVPGFVKEAITGGSK
eukprot:TRINITY_DN3203_c0_g1_i3.p1 TRINITY_DN3203_c0_g1~~TRINITY_DN3203_c0_g1_i3.p1  ORF type:complete len:821 (+),score=123.48 TRINITY_DN3203_c0_g1_i3:90-2552(+)